MWQSVDREEKKNNDLKKNVHVNLPFLNENAQSGVENCIFPPKSGRHKCRNTNNTERRSNGIMETVKSSHSVIVT